MTITHTVIVNMDVPYMMNVLPRPRFSKDNCTNGAITNVAIPPPDVAMPKAAPKFLKMGYFLY